MKELVFSLIDLAQALLVLYLVFEVERLKNK